MNERIRELLDQAQSIDPMDLNANVFDRFAELIIRECAWLVDENDISLPYGTFGKLIKGHFGVDE